MSKPLVKWPRVERDLAEHYAYIAQDKIQPADRLLIIAEESFSRLAHNPRIGVLWKSKRIQLRGIRFYPMPAPYRNYIIFYREWHGNLEIIAVLHGARDMEQSLREILN